jgi:hypothetical protein
MLINAQDDFSLLKSLFLEPFKGGSGGGGGRGSSRRKNKDAIPFNLPIFLIFALLYFFTFIFLFPSMSK